MSFATVVLAPGKRGGPKEVSKSGYRGLEEAMSSGYKPIKRPSGADRSGWQGGPSRQRLPHPRSSASRGDDEPPKSVG